MKSPRLPTQCFEAPKQICLLGVETKAAKPDESTTLSSPFDIRLSCWNASQRVSDRHRKIEAFSFTMFQLLRVSEASVVEGKSRYKIRMRGSNTAQRARQGSSLQCF